MGREPLGAGTRQHIVWVDVVAHGALGGREPFGVCRVEPVTKLGVSLEHVFGV